MVKKKNNKTNWIIGIAIVAFLYGGSQGWFGTTTTTTIVGDTINRLEQAPIQLAEETCSLSISPSTIISGQLVTGNIQASPRVFCETYAKHEGVWAKVWEGNTDINGRVTDSENIFVTGDFIFKSICGQCTTNEASLTINPSIDSDCTDSDGIDKYTPGHVTSDGVRYYDKCDDTGAAMVTEYYCNGLEVATRDIMCEPGEFCIATRSGGYCELPSTGYDDGDVISSNGGSGILPQGGQSWDIDMGDLSLGGNCGIQALISTSWNYVNEEACMGLPGMEGVSWMFSDSVSVKYSRLDAVPVAMGFPTACNLVYDGITPFKLVMLKKFNYPNCDITYNWDIDLVACNCQ